MALQFSIPPIPPGYGSGERHLPCVLLVDTSSYMGNGAIDELNKCLVEFGNALQNDYWARGCVEVCVISFNSSVQTEISFRPVDDYEAPILRATGLASMNGAVEAGLDALEARKADYRTYGLDYYRPWLFLIAAGTPTDIERENAAKARLQNAIKNRKVTFMPMSIGPNADIARLQSYYPDNMAERPVLRAGAEQFREAFKWLGGCPLRTQNPPVFGDDVQLPSFLSGITIKV